MELTYKGMPRAMLIFSLLASASCGSEDEDETFDVPRDAGTVTIPRDAGTTADARMVDESDADDEDPNSGEDSGDEEPVDEDPVDEEPVVDAGKPDSGSRPDAGTPDSGGGTADSGADHVPSAANGQVLAEDTNCASCHGLNYAGFAAGTAIAYPNITPHPTTGIGTWTDAQIASAINLGQGKRGNLCILMMRYGFSEDDTADLIAFLRALPPVNKTIVDVCQ